MGALPCGGINLHYILALQYLELVTESLRIFQRDLDILSNIHLGATSRPEAGQK